LVHGPTLTALLDWEMAHLGDPHEDLAWVQIRMVHSPFGSFGQRLEDYGAASGRPLVRERLEWNVALVLLKTVVALTAALRRPSDGRVVVPQFGMLLAYRALLASALVGLRGGDGSLLTRSPVPEDVPSSRLIEQLSHLATAAPREHRLISDYLVERERMAEWARAERALAENVEPTLEDLLVDADLALYPHRHAVRWVRAAQETGLGR
jgi:hypothetical protein